MLIEAEQHLFSRYRRPFIDTSVNWLFTLYLVRRRCAQRVYDVSIPIRPLTLAHNEYQTAIFWPTTINNYRTQCIRRTLFAKLVYILARVVAKCRPKTKNAFIGAGEPARRSVRRDRLTLSSDRYIDLFTKGYIISVRIIIRIPVVGTAEPVVYGSIISMVHPTDSSRGCAQGGPRVESC